jgi:hypothetical protein
MTGPSEDGWDFYGCCQGSAMRSRPVDPPGRQRACKWNR